MSRVLAIARLTFAEGVRMRIVLVFLIVLVILVLRMPFALRGDETLTGRLQNFLSYSLGALGGLLSLSTMFFSCATLTNEIRERSLHLVVTKPVTRVQILIGKWLGVNLLNVLITVLCGGAIYGFAYFIQTRPEQFQRDRVQVRDVVWTARVAAAPVVPVQQIRARAVEDVKERLRTGEIAPSLEGLKLAEQMNALTRRWWRVENGEDRVFEFEKLTPPQRSDTVIQVRYKPVAIPPPPDELITLAWVFCDPDNGAPLHPPLMRQTRTGQTDQFLVRATPVVKEGRALLRVINPYNPARRTGVLFETEKDLQVLYRVGGFEANFLKALAILLLRLTMLSALGLFFGTFVSFPVACLCVACFYVICMTSPFILESVGATYEITSAQYDPYGSWGPSVRALLVPFLRGAFPSFAYYSGVDRLIDGTYISASLLGWTVLRTFVYGAAVLFVPGWLIFQRREVAEVTV